MLKIENLSKSYSKGTYAVKNLNLEIEAGDVYGFIGHNGAGKTTTIKAATGVMQFDEGDIYIDGISIKEDPVACKRLIAYIPDTPELYENMTGMKYLGFISDIYSLTTSERTERIAEYASALELDTLNDSIASYSHGMKQKLVIIAGFIHSPKLLIMDEPFVGLDPKATHTVKQLMSDMCATGGAVFFSTHILEVAEKICNKMAIIKNGELVKAGTTEEVKGDSSLEEIFLEITE